MSVKESIRSQALLSRDFNEYLEERNSEEKNDNREYLIEFETIINSDASEHSKFYKLSKSFQDLYKREPNQLEVKMMIILANNLEIPDEFITDYLKLDIEEFIYNGDASDNERKSLKNAHKADKRKIQLFKYYSKAIKQTFNDSDFVKKQATKKGFDFHHWIEIRWDHPSDIYKNSFSNLCYLPMFYHQFIHVYEQQQLKKAVIGEPMKAIINNGVVLYAGPDNQVFEYQSDDVCNKHMIEDESKLDTNYKLKDVALVASFFSGLER